MNFNFRNKPLWKINQNAGAAVDDRQSLISSRDRLTEPSQEPLSPNPSDKALINLSDQRLDEMLSMASRKLRGAHARLSLSFLGAGLVYLTLAIFDISPPALGFPLDSRILFLAGGLGLSALGMVLSSTASLKWEELIQRLAPLNLDGESERSETLHLIKTSKSARLLARRAQDQGRVLRAFDLAMMKEAQKQEQSERTGRELQRRLRAP